MSGSLTPDPTPSPLRPESGLPAFLDPVRAYFARAWSILSEPAAFFRALPLTGGWATPLAFAIASHWIGAAISFLWGIALWNSLGRAYHAYFERFNALLQASRINSPLWLWGVGRVLLDPFFTILWLLFSASVVTMGARLLIRARPPGDPATAAGTPAVNYEATLRILCYAAAAQLVGAVPVMGAWLAALGQIILTVVGFREAYRISGTRATAVALFPWFLSMLCLFLLVLLLVVAGVGIFHTLFGAH